MKTFGDLYVNDKLFIINNNCTIDIYEIIHFKCISHSVLICTALKRFILSANRTYERFNNIVVCSNPITAKATLEGIQYNINFSLKKLENIKQFQKEQNKIFKN